MKRIAVPVCLILYLFACMPILAHSLQNATTRSLAGPTTSPTRQIGSPDDPCNETTTKPVASLKPLDQCRAHLSHARCILVVRCAPLLSKGLITDGSWDTELKRSVDPGLSALEAAA